MALNREGPGLRQIKRELANYLTTQAINLHLVIVEAMQCMKPIGQLHGGGGCEGVGEYPQSERHPAL